MKVIGENLNELDLGKNGIEEMEENWKFSFKKIDKMEGKWGRFIYVNENILFRGGDDRW